MEKLPQRETLASAIDKMLSTMDVGETRDYDTENRNYETFRQTYYQVTKNHDGEFITKLNRKENLLTIIRIK